MYQLLLCSGIEPKDLNLDIKKRPKIGEHGKKRGNNSEKEGKLGKE